MNIDHWVFFDYRSCKGDNRIEQGERNRVPQTTVYTVARSSL